jgi:dihydrofolate reductase
MTKVNAHMSMSLADPNDGIEQLFGWYFSGQVTVPTTSPPHAPFQTDAASADVLRNALANTDALIAGRRLFDIAGGWGGTHPAGVPVFVVTHSIPDGWPREDAPFTVVTDRIHSAVAQAKAVAGDKTAPWPAPTSPSSARIPGCWTRWWSA